MKSFGGTCVKSAPGEEGNGNEVSGHGDPPRLRGGAGRGGPVPQGGQPAIPGGRHRPAHRGAPAGEAQGPRPVEAPVRAGRRGRLPLPGILRLLSAQLHRLRHPAHPDQPGRGDDGEPHRPGAGPGGAQRRRRGSDRGVRLSGQGPGDRRRRAGGAGHRHGLSLRWGHHLHHRQQLGRGLAGPGGGPGPGSAGGAVRRGHRHSAGRHGRSDAARRLSGGAGGGGGAGHAPGPRADPGDGGGPQRRFRRAGGHGLRPRCGWDHRLR